MAKLASGDIFVSLDRGDRLDGVTFVVEGSLRLARGAGSGTGRVFYTDVKAGGQFGEMAALGVEEQGLTVIAREDGLVATLAEHRFLDLLSRGRIRLPGIALPICSIVESARNHVASLNRLGGGHQRPAAF